jgi:hypothetical protein
LREDINLLVVSDNRRSAQPDLSNG